MQAVRPFLYNLFSDRKIIQLGPSFLQKPLAWLISMLRSKKTESYYRLIGGRSPILDITNAQAKALEEELNQSAEAQKRRSAEVSSFQTSRLPDFQTVFKVFVGMRYWHPLIEDVIPQIYNDGVRKLIGLSLYPQYSLATSGSSLSKFREVASKHYTEVEVFCAPSWYDHPLYIEALVDMIKKGIESFNSKLQTPNSKLDIHVLFSAHSLPEKFIDEGDPYVRHIERTIEEIVKR
ncbi:MAG: ferrochelatase, partial [Thermodesulfovibrionales bacterium]|nr:ferrochelatase [Thermodesulfovibrionales bacterium]